MTKSSGVAVSLVKTNGGGPIAAIAIDMGPAGPDMIAGHEAHATFQRVVAMVGREG